VTVATSVAFATYWLMPRIPNFRAAHPDIELRITAFDPYVDPVREGVDAAIRYGGGDWPGLETTRLFADEIFPVCSPAYLRANPGLTSLDALAEHTLLHLDVSYQDWVDWGDWFRAQGRAAPGHRSGLLFNTYTLLIQAAVAGQGIALGWRHLVQDFLEAGQLVRPIAPTMQPRGAYHLVHAEGTALAPETQTFVDWVLDEAAPEPDGV
jgi:DNA-binding transcriptional LysR family regulator